MFALSYDSSLSLTDEVFWMYRESSSWISRFFSSSSSLVRGFVSAPPILFIKKIQRTRTFWSVFHSRVYYLFAWRKETTDITEKSSVLVRGCSALSGVGINSSGCSGRHLFKSLRRLKLNGKEGRKGQRKMRKES
jgi:hypothetical protein